MEHGWDMLSLYENIDQLKRLYRGKHGASLKVAEAREIASYFAQGHEYFRSAAGAGELVRPLILFYGVMALSRGLVLFLDTSGTKPKTTHGLGEARWVDLNEKPSQLPNCKVVVRKDGTFPQFHQIIQNSERNRLPANGYPWVVDTLQTSVNPITTNMEFSIKEILGQIPDLSEIFESTFDEFSQCLHSEVQCMQDIDDADEGWVKVAVLQTRLGVPKPKKISRILKRPEIAKRPIEDYHHFASTDAKRLVRNFFFELPYKRDPRLDAASGIPISLSRRSGEAFLKLPTSQDVSLATPVALYLISYAMGILVRYHPGYWMAQVGRGTGASMAPILSAAALVVEELFPQLILENLS